MASNARSSEWEQGWQRIQKAFHAATAKVEFGEDVCPVPTTPISQICMRCMRILVPAPPPSPPSPPSCLQSGLYPCRYYQYPQAPEAPPEAREWAENTLVGVMFGMVLGGGRQWLADRQVGACRAADVHQ